MMLTNIDRYFENFKVNYFIDIVLQSEVNIIECYRIEKIIEDPCLYACFLFNLLIF